MMLYNTRDYWGFGLCPSSRIPKNTTFRELGLKPELSSITGPVIELRYFYRTKQSSRPPPHPFLKKEADPISEMLCSLEYRTMEKVPKTNNPWYI
jgi:hypothetical protein